jgi:predicted RNase H-related nuclease YkuK (DUF458 family)
MFTQEQIEEIKEYLVNVGIDSRVYLGCDSQKYRKGNTWYARYTVVLVVHINNLHGCKIFGYTDTERDYDAVSKPRMRLMNEVYKVSELYLQLAEELEDREVEIHLDVNPDERYESSAVVKQACGYILGVCNIKPKVKPEAFAASYAADAGVRGRWKMTE